jgi:hypothetical protein
MISKKTELKFVHIGPGRFGYYGIENKNDEPLATLVQFLISELNSHSYVYFMDWLTGKYAQNWAGGNAFNLEEEGQDVAIYLEAYHSISDDDDDEDDDKYAETYYKDIPGIVYFQINRKVLIDIVERWVDIVSKENAPANIAIIQDEQGNVDIVPQL